MDNIFYTYAYLREDGTPYYIGKGKGNRCYRNDGRRCRKPKDSSLILILKENLTEEEAFRHERYMIAIFGKKVDGTGILRNLSDGGQGIAGCARPDLSDYNTRTKKGVPLPEETRKKLGDVARGRVLPHMAEVGRRNISAFHERRKKDPSLNEEFLKMLKENGRKGGLIAGPKNKGKKHSPEVNAKKGSPKEKNPMWGKVRITNGVINTQINADEPIPEGFWRGLTANSKKGRLSEPPTA